MTFVCLSRLKQAVIMSATCHSERTCKRKTTKKTNFYYKYTRIQERRVKRAPSCLCSVFCNSIIEKGILPRHLAYDRRHSAFKISIPREINKKKYTLIDDSVSYDSIDIFK
jgi:hypothetical protein